MEKFKSSEKNGLDNLKEFTKNAVLSLLGFGAAVLIGNDIRHTVDEVNFVLGVPQILEIALLAYVLGLAIDSGKDAVDALKN